MSDFKLLVRRLMSEAEAASWVTEEELKVASSFASERRRCEFLTWRALVREFLGAEVQIAYNEVGAPVLLNREEQLSVSHTADCVAVAIAHRRVGVDIERLDRRYQRILSKYLTPKEQALSEDRLYPAAAWCAKEAIYKWAGIEGLSFEEVEICSFTANRLTARIRGGEELELKIEYPDEEHILVYLG